MSQAPNDRRNNERRARAKTIDKRQEKAAQNAPVSKPTKAQHLDKLDKGLKNY
jgi:hypothetical protein